MLTTPLGKASAAISDIIAVASGVYGDLKTRRNLSETPLQIKLWRGLLVCLRLKDNCVSRDDGRVNLVTGG